MADVVKNILKSGTIMFVVGATLALVAPSMAQGIGIDHATLGHTADALWMGCFFGAFGAIQAAFSPVFNMIFGEDKASAPALAPAKEKMPTIVVHISPEIAVEKEKAVFQSRLDVERMMETFSLKRG